jgi:hypothetical protein
LVSPIGCLGLQDLLFALAVILAAVPLIEARRKTKSACAPCNGVRSVNLMIALAQLVLSRQLSLPMSVPTAPKLSNENY